MNWDGKIIIIIIIIYFEILGYDIIYFNTNIGMAS